MCAYSAILWRKIINNKSIQAIELSKIPRDIWAMLALSEIIPTQISDGWFCATATHQSTLPRILGTHTHTYIYIYIHIYIYIYVCGFVCVCGCEWSDRYEIFPRAVGRILPVKPFSSVFYFPQSTIQSTVSSQPPRQICTHFLMFCLPSPRESRVSGYSWRSELKYVDCKGHQDSNTMQCIQYERRQDPGVYTVK